MKLFVLAVSHLSTHIEFFFVLEGMFVCMDINRTESALEPELDRKKMTTSQTSPNLCALLGEQVAQQLLSLPGVSHRTLLASSPAAITHLGKPSAASAAASSFEAHKNCNNSNDDLGRGFLYTGVPLISSLDPSVRVKGANIVAAAIKAAAGADLGKSSPDGAVGRDQLEKAKKRLEALVPMVDYIDDDQKVLDLPTDGSGGGSGGSAGGNKNSQHRAGAQTKRQRELEKLEKQIKSKIGRCTTDEDREKALKSRDVQALLDQKRILLAGSGPASKAQNQQQEQLQQQSNVAGATRRARDEDHHHHHHPPPLSASSANALEAAAKKQVDDEYGDL